VRTDEIAVIAHSVLLSSSWGGGTVTVSPNCPPFRAHDIHRGHRMAYHTALSLFRKSVTREKLRRSRQARRAQLSTLSHLLTVLPRAAEFRESWVTAGSLHTPHLARVCLKLSNEFLKPRVADAQLPSPVTT
jgi:hypothetical protein